MARRIDALRLTRERYERMLREQEITALATEAELRALRAQVNPHFLFNTLTTLGHLIQHAPPRALTTLMRLTTLLRGVLRSDGELTTLGRERELIRCYLDIEQERFEERLAIDIDIPDELPRCRSPRSSSSRWSRTRSSTASPAPVSAARSTSSARVWIERRQSTRSTSASPTPARPRDLDAPDESNGVGLALVARRLRACYGERRR